MNLNEIFEQGIDHKTLQRGGFPIKKTNQHLEIIKKLRSQLACC